MGMQDKSKERKDSSRGKARPQSGSTAAPGDRARERAQDMNDPMRHDPMRHDPMRRDDMHGDDMRRDEMPERMRRERMGSEEMLEDEIG